MAKKLKHVAKAIKVIATIESRCRAGYAFSDREERRIELDTLSNDALAAIEADPYLKVTYETEETPIEEVEARINELEKQLLAKETELREVRADSITTENALNSAQSQINTLDDALIKANAEVEILKAKVTELEKAAGSKAKK